MPEESSTFPQQYQNVFVTGATGFIGRNLVSALLANDKKVTVLTRNTKKAARIFDGKVNCVTRMDELPDDFSADVIINLAGARILGWPWTKARRNVLRKSRIELTEKIVAWISKAQHKPKLLLSASAIGYYGIQEQSDATELNEDSPTQNIFMAHLCNDWEIASQSAERYGVKVVNMRFGVVLGHQGALPMLLLPIKLFFGGALGRGTQWMSWIHIEDLLRGIAHIWQLQEHNSTQPFSVYNFTAPQAVSQFEFSKIAAAILHRPCFFKTPGWPIRFALGEQADLLLEGQRVAPANLLATDFEFKYHMMESALRNLLQE